MICGILLHWQAPSPHGPEPGPRAALAGTAGFQVVSRLDFGERSNRLTAIYSFPDRARWHFESYSARARSEHQYFYRLGERVRAFEGGPSRELLDGERDGLLLQMELRRAVMFWPDGFPWEGATPESRSAPVFIDSCCGEGELGALDASLADGRLARVVARDREGKVLESLEVRAWQELSGRQWPLTLVMQGAQGAFTETVESIETQTHFLELSFVPPDQRPTPPSPSQGPRVQAREIVSMTYKVQDLPPGIPWAEAELLARKRLEEAGLELAQLGLEVDPVPTFEIDEAGRPERMLLRLSAPCRPSPRGFVTLSERPGLLLGLGKTEEVEARTLGRLLDSVPAGARPGTPYVRLHARKEIPVEVVLPIEAGR